MNMLWRHFTTCSEDTSRHPAKKIRDKCAVWVEGADHYWLECFVSMAAGTAQFHDYQSTMGGLYQRVTITKKDLGCDVTQGVTCELQGRAPWRMVQTLAGSTWRRELKGTWLCCLNLRINAQLLHFLVPQARDVASVWVENTSFMNCVGLFLLPSTAMSLVTKTP